MRKIIGSFLILSLILSLTGCKGIVYSSPESKVNQTLLSSETFNLSPISTMNLKKFTFRDVYGEEYTVDINEKVEKCPYNKTLFKLKNDYILTYEDKNYTSRFGVDVSRHIGKIDWKKVKATGAEFAIIRIAFRGYGKAGNLKMDGNFKQNIDGALNSGLDVGVYIYSQAINEEEATEEADFVLKNLNGRKLTLPIVYDPESVLNDVARTDNVTPEQFTKNSIAFCKRIKEAGFEPMIYCNMLWEAYNLDLSQLKDIPIWYADYESKPQTPYNFEFWQYSNTGRIPGINADVDLNIQLIKK